MTGQAGTVGFTKQEEGSQFSPGSNAWKVWKSQSQVPQFPRQPCHGECPKAQRRGRQRFPTPISWEGGDTHIALPPGHCTFATNTMPGPATPRGLCVLSGGAPGVQRLSTAMAQAPTTYSPPSPALKAHRTTPFRALEPSVGYRWDWIFLSPREAGHPGLAGIPTLTKPQNWTLPLLST